MIIPQKTGFDVKDYKLGLGSCISVRNTLYLNMQSVLIDFFVYF